MTIDGHTPGIIVPKSQPFQYNFDLIGNVLQNKQVQFDSAYSGLQKLRRDSLNINFLNKKEQGKVDTFNQKINNFFDGISDLGDLSNSSLTTRYTALFNEIGKDQTLISRYQQDSAYRQELKTVHEKRDSKDPRKAGYHPINYANYVTRLNNYSEADLDKQDIQVAGYTNYTDIMKGQLEAVKQIPVKKFTREKQLGNGYIEKRTYSGKDPEQVSMALRQYLQTDGAAQLKEQAEYYFRETVKDADDYNYLHQQHQTRVSQGVNQLESNIASLKEDMVGMTGDELTQASNRVNELSDSLNNLQNQQMSLTDFMAQPEGDLISQMYSLQMSDTIVQNTEAYGGYAESVTYEPDKAFLALQNYGLALNKHQTDTAFRQQEIDIKQAKLALDTQASTGNSLEAQSQITHLAKADPTRLDVASSYKTLTGVVENLLSYTSNPFTTTADGEQIVDDKYQSVVHEMWINNKIDPVAQNNPYVKAYHIGMAQAKRQGKGREAAMRYAHSRVQSIMSSPETDQEIAIFNENQDLLASKLSLEKTLTEAQQSNDPARYIKDKDLGFAFQYQRNNLDAKAWSESKSISDEAQKQRNKLANEMMDYMDIDSPNQEFEDDDYKYVSRIDPNLIIGSEVHMDGTVDVFFNEDAYSESKGKVGDNNYKPAGPLNNGYYSYVDKEGITQHQKIEGGKITLNIPERNLLNVHTDLGSIIDHTPQTRYAMSRSRVPTPFQVVRDIDGTYMYKINGVDLPGADRDGWVSSNRTKAGDVIEAIRNTIQTEL